MPYLIEQVTEPGGTCAVGQWATVKEDGEVMGCHDTKDDAIDQGVAIAQAEGSEFLGEREARELPDNYRPALSEDVPEGRACGNCIFYNEDRVSDDGRRAWCERWADFVEGDHYCNAWEPDDEDDDMDDELRQVDLEPPAYMRASARRGLEWYEAGRGGEGLVEATIREARAMENGSVTADKWTRISAWIARHLVDLDAPAANPENPAYPSPGVVAMALWGGGVNKRQAERALEYAKGVVERLTQENEDRAKGQAAAKLETRVQSTKFEVREDADGMTFEGYAAVFNSASEPLPFIERIAPGAFKRTLRERSDVKLLWNHDSNHPLASTRGGSLKLTEDNYGLRVEARLANTQAGRDAAELIRTNVVDAMSFGFTVPEGGAEWNENGTERTLKSVRLFEVSVVPWPAYPSTGGTVSVRGLAALARRAAVDVDALADALMKLENGEAISQDERQLIDQVLDEVAPKVEEKVEDDKGLAMLELKKKKLQLLLDL
jgi:HK97 family phage prohead protease